MDSSTPATPSDDSADSTTPAPASATPRTPAPRKPAARKPATGKPAARSSPAPASTPDETTATGETTPTGATSAPAAKKPAAPRKPAAARKPATPRTPAATPASQKPASKKPAAPKAQAASAASRTPAARTPAATTGAAARKPAARTTAARTASAKKAAAARIPAAVPPPPPPAPVVLEVRGLRKSFGRTVAVDGIDLDVRRGSIFGFLGPNGAGKTTSLGMITGLLRPQSGTVLVTGHDVWREPGPAKRALGSLPDRMRLFDRLTGAQMLYYCGVLHGLDRASARARTADLAAALGLEEALARPVRDYSVGMIKKVSLAAALIHSPKVLVLDEPFESVDPVSASQAIELLRAYSRAGGTVVLSSHNMDLVERVCDSVAVIVAGRILASGTVDEVRDGRSLEDRFVELAGGRAAVEGLEWLTTFSD